MNYKEKYEQALEKARELMDKGYYVLIPEIFPELKKSEDESIKNEIIAFVVQSIHRCGGTPIPQEQENKWIAWLEKQGEKKPTDEVEPKFKVGDWIACKELNTARIINIEGDKYEVEFIDGSKGFPHIEWVDRNLHLWTIQDAKDGDVLVSKDDRPFIFTGEFDVQDDNPTAYCGINSNDKFITGKGSHWTFKDGIKPATKEQRELLFTKMNEAGYKWDAEKKEVKKIEPKFKVGDFIINDYCLGKVIEITNDAYLLDTGQGIPFSCEHNAHLWTIKDAKDGDVLIRETGEPFIHNGNHGSYIPEFLGAYCGISDGRFRPNGSPYYWGKPSCPATKEQRDLLFSKMKEEGYEWDANKKELKKMESKTLNADKVIEWLNDQACLGWLEDVEVEKVVEQFKKDFGL